VSTISTAVTGERQKLYAPLLTTADGMAGEVSAHEWALRKLPLPYSLALRLRDAGAAPEVVSEYLAVPQDRLDGIYRMAEAKFVDTQRMTSNAEAAHRWPSPSASPPAQITAGHPK
jgi:hypothetical protein